MQYLICVELFGSGARSSNLLLLATMHPPPLVSERCRLTHTATTYPGTNVSSQTEPTFVCAEKDRNLWLTPDTVRPVDDLRRIDSLLVHL